MPISLEAEDPGREPGGESLQPKAGRSAARRSAWRNEFWSVGFFSSTVGIDEQVIKRYVEFRENVDTGKLQLERKF